METILIEDSSDKQDSEGRGQTEMNRQGEGKERGMNKYSDVERLSEREASEMGLMADCIDQGQY